jgi:hypothetical protein
MVDKLGSYIVNGIAYYIGSYVDVTIDCLTAAVSEIIGCSDVIGVDGPDLSLVGSQPIRVFKKLVDIPNSLGLPVWSARCMFDCDRILNIPPQSDFVRLCAEKLNIPMLVDLPPTHWVEGYFMVVDPDGSRYVLEEKYDEQASTVDNTVVYLDLSRDTWEKFEDWAAKY